MHVWSKSDAAAAELRVGDLSSAASASLLEQMLLSLEPRQHFALRKKGQGLTHVYYIFKSARTPTAKSYLGNIYQYK